ncbi:MAG: hypothetical protein J5545_02305 [Bacteroidaceae bacterium]|nr:hypothetical protein [Bacteroidaceae bacterium]
MKKEFGKWFLDLAKYILTAIAFTTLFTGMEEIPLLWTTFAAFSVCVLFGYLLLRQSDMEKSKVETSVKMEENNESNQSQTGIIKNVGSSKKNNKTKKRK